MKKWKNPTLSTFTITDLSRFISAYSRSCLLVFFK